MRVCRAAVLQTSLVNAKHGLTEDFAAGDDYYVLLYRGGSVVMTMHSRIQGIVSNGGPR